MYMCIYLWKCQWCHIQTLSSHNHTEPLISINFRYHVNDLVQCVEKKRWYEVIYVLKHRLVIKACQMLLIITVNCKKKKGQHVKLLLYTSHSMILGRVAAFSYSDCSKSKIFRRRRKNHTNNGLLRLKIRKINIKIIEHHRALEHHVNMERFIGIIIPFMWKTGIPIAHDQMTTLHWLMIPLAN